MKVLVIGGYGNFGQLIAERLASGPFEVVVAGRDAAAAAACAARIGVAHARIDAAAADFEACVLAQAPGLVISAAGPFQGQGYRTAKAALLADAHYIDIADGRAFVCGIGALDAQARKRGRLVVSGASSVPALSSAVVDRYAQEFRELRDIDMGISSSATLPGAATTDAVLSYCGRPLPRWRNGRSCKAVGLGGIRRVRFRDPPMTRWISDCDVPDLEIFPARYPSLRNLSFGAGTEMAAVQWGLWCLAALRRVGLPGDPSAWSSGLRSAAKWLTPRGSGRSAMFVELRGLDVGGQPHRRRWELRAEHDEGRHVPCLAAVALARKLAEGRLTAVGAQPCVGLVSLDEYLGELGDLRVVAGLCS